MTAAEVCRLVETSEARAYALLEECASQATRRSFGLSVERIGGAYAFLATGLKDSLLLNRVIGLGVEEPMTTDLIAQLDRHYREGGVMTYAAEVAPTGVRGPVMDQLLAAGFLPFKQTHMMHRRSDPVPEVSSDLQVCRVGFEHAESFVSLCRDVFGLAPPFSDLLRDSFGVRQQTHWLAFEGDTVAAAALTTRISDDVAWIGWVCTKPSHRGRGAQSALAAAQLRACQEDGIGWVTLEAAAGSKRQPSQSLRNYTRLGWCTAYQRVVMLRRQTD